MPAFNNGWIIRKDARGRFVLQEYDHKNELPPVENADKSVRFMTLQDAVLGYEEADPNHKKAYRLLRETFLKEIRSQDLHIL